MRTLWRQLFTPLANDDVLNELRRSYIQILAAITVVTGIIGIIVQMVTGPVIRPATVTTFIVVVISAALFLLVRRGLITLAGMVLVGLLIASTTITPPVVFTLMATLALVSAAVLVPLPVYVLTNILVFTKLSLEGLNSGVPLITEAGGPSQELVNSLLTVLTLIIVSFTTRYFLFAGHRAIETSRRNALLLRATADAGQVITALRDTEVLFRQSVELIQERLGYYHVQIFLIDEHRENAVLTASTGEAGRELLARRHRLAVGGNSVVGKAAGSAISVLAMDTNTSDVHRRNELLPNTRSELGIPIIEENIVIGVLDVQSTQRNAFRSEDIQALQTIANLLATAISNARLFEEQARAVKEQQRLFLESEANLRENRRLNQQLTKAGWAEYISQPRVALGVTLQDNRLRSETGWTEGLAQAAYSRRAVVQPQNGHAGTVAVPVLLRGEVIGAIEIEPGEGATQKEIVEMMEVVAERLAVSLENARLFEESQAATIQEQQLNEIVSRYQEVTNVDDLLRITVTELSETLGAQQAAIRLGVIRDEVVEALEDSGGTSQ